MNSDIQEKYDGIYKSIETKNIQILSESDIKENFPEHYKKQEFLEYIGRKSFFSGLLKQSIIFFNAIGIGLDPYDHSLKASACYYLEEFEDAIQSYKQAAEGGYPRSYYWLGRMYQEGLGVSANEDQAYKYYCLGAKHEYVLPTKACLKIEMKNSSIFRKIFIKFKFVIYGIKVIYMAFKNVNDERLADFMPK